MISEKPLCPVFGECGGCTYQDITYEKELSLKQEKINNLFNQNGITLASAIKPIVSSPKHYYYRHRIDLKLKQYKLGDMAAGFSPPSGKGVVSVNACYLAEPQISELIPEIKRKAIDSLPLKYRTANLTIKTGADGRVCWGGIGKRSLSMKESDYFWTEICGRKVFFTLETFFQANLFILPKLFETIRSFDFWDKETIFYDIYGGVGLFSLGLVDLVKEVVLVECCADSSKIAKFNRVYHWLTNMEVIQGRIELKWKELTSRSCKGKRVAMIDPPRSGLSKQASEFFSQAKELEYLMYLSCNPATLVRDLKIFVNQGWKVIEVIPFDFFPRTPHVETLVVMRCK